MRTLVLTGYGINSDLELAECFRRAGSEVIIRHLNEVIADKKTIFDFDTIAFPGGFSFGDHVASGKIFANKIKTFLLLEIQEFVKRGNPVIGICNGFQVLVKCGLLPNVGINNQKIPKQEVTLTHNDSGVFEDRWVRLKANINNDSLWLKNIEDIELPIRHGEGKFYASQKLINMLEKNNQIALQYTDKNSEITQKYPDNPNGSLQAISAITNRAGNVLGMMPHPEAYMDFYNKPNWNKNFSDSKSDKTKSFSSPLKKKEGEGMIFFYNAVDFVKNQK